jgi:hypothetical protein
VTRPAAPGKPAPHSPTPRVPPPPGAAGWGEAPLGSPLPSEAGAFAGGRVTPLCRTHRPPRTLEVCLGKVSAQCDPARESGERSRGAVRGAGDAGGGGLGAGKRLGVMGTPRAAGEGLAQAGAHLGPDLGLAVGPRAPRACGRALGLVHQRRLELGQVALGARGAVAVLVVLLLALVLEGQQLVRRAEVVTPTRAALAGVQLRHGALRPPGRGTRGTGSAGHGAGPRGGEPGVWTSEPGAGQAERGLTPPGRAVGAGRGRRARPLRELAGPNIKGAAGGVPGAGRAPRGRARRVGGASGAGNASSSPGRGWDAPTGHTRS